jgi:hypothetical protein
MPETLRAVERGVLAAVAQGGAKSQHGLSLNEIIAQVAIWAGIVCAAAAVIAIVPQSRQAVRRIWRALLMRAGAPRRGYARWFVREWGIYDNPYLDVTENLDLRNTYVPLSFRSDDDPQETLTVATEVLAKADAGNLIIYGGPGSGKSTLLKAYGVGVLQDQVPWRRAPRIVPFFVQLRKLARFLSDEKGLADYLVEKVLVAEAGMSQSRASEFLDYSLARRQVIVMLDGLDEVMTEHYEVVRLAVFDFIGDHNPDRPTYLARMLLTCRRQNFLTLRDDWVAFARRECSLAPLRNSEIFSYLDKTRRLFKTPDGPENFMQAVRASGTLDLHRIPLILAMSVGLYSRRDYFEIPSSIADLYRMMIREMLDRHSFRRDPGGKALRFQVGDKYRFLREFSLYAAYESGGFDDFGKGDMVDFALSLAPQLDAVRDPDGMVDEIIDRSGLLTDVREGKTFVFAHRSIQEFLVAEQLRTINDGDDLLIDRAEDQEWRQVVQFYTAGQEQRQIDEFLKDLSAVNAELAAYCLVGAKASDAVAGIVLDALEPIDDVRVSALAAATMSPRAAIREIAIERLKTALTSSEQPLYAEYDLDGLLPLINSLAATNAAEIAALMPLFLDLSPDPRLVEPLWRCLAVPGIERHDACGRIVNFLLRLVVDPNSLDELTRQDRYNRAFLTEEIRWRAYPFNAGLDRSHNLVTLLAWAEYLDVGPEHINRFFEAKAAGRLDRVEADRRRTISFSLWWPARLLSGLEIITVSIVTIIVLARDPRQLVHPFGWLTLLLVLGVAAGPLALEIVVVNDNNMEKRASFSGNAYAPIEEELSRLSETSSFLVLLIIIPLLFAIAATPLMTGLLAWYIVLGLVGQALFWATDTKVCSRDHRFYLYKPNQFVDMYDDPESQHWLGMVSPSLLLGDKSLRSHRLA